MSPPDATLLSASAADPQDRQARLHDWRMCMLQATAEHGVALLEDVRRKAQDDAAPFSSAPQLDLGLAYSRIAKAVRQTVMLHAKFEEEAGKSAEQKQAEAAAALAAEAQRAAQAEAGRKAHQKRQVKRAVKLAMDVAFDAAEARKEQQFDYADTHLELLDRLDDYDDYSDFGRLPVGAVVENICRVLGIAFDPALWEDEPWAAAEMRDKPDGSPYAEWAPEAETANDDGESGEENEDNEDDPYGLTDEPDEQPRRRSRAPPWAAE